MGHDLLDHLKGPFSSNAGMPGGDCSDEEAARADPNLPQRFPRRRSTLWSLDRSGTGSARGWSASVEGACLRVDDSHNRATLRALRRET